MPENHDPRALCSSGEAFKYRNCNVHQRVWRRGLSLKPNRRCTCCRLDFARVCEDANAMSNPLSVVQIPERLDAEHGPEAERMMRHQIGEGVRHLRLDLGNTAYVSSAGLRVLVSLYRELQQLGGSLQIVAVHPNAERVLELAGYGSLLQTPDGTGVIQGSDHYTTESVRAEVFSLGPGGYTLSRLSARSSFLAETASTQLPLAIGLGRVAVEEGGEASDEGWFLAASGLVLHQPRHAKTPDFFEASGMLRPQVRPVTGLGMEGGPNVLMRLTRPNGEQAMGLTEIFDILVSHHHGPTVVFGAIRVAGLELPCFRSPAKRTGGVGGPHLISAEALGAEQGLQVLLAGVVTPMDGIPPALEGLPVLNAGARHFYGMALLAHDVPLPAGAFPVTQFLDAATRARLLALGEPVGDGRHGMGLQLECGVLWSGPVRGGM